MVGEKIWRDLCLFNERNGVKVVSGDKEIKRGRGSCEREGERWKRGFVGRGLKSERRYGMVFEVGE